MKDNKQLTEKELDQVNGGHHWVGHEYFWKIQRARNSFRKSATVGIKNENRKKVGTVQREINLPRIP